MISTTGLPERIEAASLMEARGIRDQLIKEILEQYHSPEDQAGDDDDETWQWFLETMAQDGPFWKTIFDRWERRENKDGAYTKEHLMSLCRAACVRCHKLEAMAIGYKSRSYRALLRED